MHVVHNEHGNGGVCFMNTVFAMNSGVHSTNIIVSQLTSNAFRIHDYSAPHCYMIDLRLLTSL